MKISIKDLYDHVDEMLWALEHGENVHLMSRGKLKGIIEPVSGRPRS